MLVIITKTRLFNKLKISPPKPESFSDKNSYIFHISAQNIDCGFHISALNIDCGYSLEPPRRGGSDEYPQSMVLSRMRKLMYTPVNPSFNFDLVLLYKSEVKGVKII